MKLLLYHGTPQDNIPSIFKNGFNISSNNRGKTYGNGVYLTGDLQTAKIYSGCGPVIIYKVEIYKPFYAQNRKKYKWWKHYDSYISADLEEVVVKNPRLVIPLKISG